MSAGDQAKKGENPQINISDSLNTARTVVSLPQGNPVADTTRTAGAVPAAQNINSPNPCQKIQDIRGICEKLHTFCEENVDTILELLNGETAGEKKLNCTVTDGRCSKDVVAAKCPIKAMFDCRNKYKSCANASFESCSEFDRMATCPFADKKGIGRCDYWFRLWKSSLPNDNPEKNKKNSVCGDEVYTKNGDPLPLSVKECCNSNPVPDKTDITLKVRPVYSENFSLVVNSDGFGVRFYTNSKGWARGEHKGADIRSFDPKCVDLTSAYFKNVVLKDKDNKRDTRGNGFIFCVADGIMSKASTASGGGGWTVRIDHPKNLTRSREDFFTTYMHMSYPPECNVNFYIGQRMGINPYNKKVVRAPFAGKIVYHSKCEDKNIWGAGKIYDVILSSLKDEESYEYLSEFFKKNIKNQAESGLIKMFGRSMEYGLGQLWNYFSNYMMGDYRYKKKDGKLTDLNLYFARLWVPYLMNDMDLPVKAGEIIGFESNTGLETAPGREHVHFEISKVKGGPKLNCYKVLDSSISAPPKNIE